jgi:molecular chaperone DnaK (HSP70)
VVIPIVEGEARQPEDCVQLGECLIDDLPEDIPTGNQVVVDYELDASGLITVVAGIPGARRGARVQITRSNARDFGSLNTWCELLTRKAREKATTRPATRETLLRELDERCIQLGQTALLNSVPHSIAADKEAAVRAFRAVEVAQQALAAAELHQNDAVSRAERIQASSDVAKCKARVRETQQQYRFLLLGLGRLIIQHRIMLPESVEILREIQRIQQLFLSKPS